MPNETTMEVAALQYAINILQERLDGLQGQTKTRPAQSVLRSSISGFTRKSGKRTMSPEGRARIAAAQRARWALAAKQKTEAAEGTAETAEGARGTKKRGRKKGGGA